MPRTSEQCAAFFSIEPAKRLIENDESGLGAQGGAPETHTLPFTSRHQSATLTEWRLQSVLKRFQDAIQLGLLDDFADWLSACERRAVA